MTLILIINIVVLGSLCAVALLRGFERALPLAAFLMILFPSESQLHLSGLFDLTTQRLVVIALAVLFVLTGRPQKEPAGGGREIPLKYLLLMLIGWLLFSTLNSVVFTISFKAFLSQVFDFFVPYYIFSKSVSKVETVQRILFALVTAMFVCSIFGAIEAYQNWNVVSLFPQTLHRFAGFAGVTDRGIRVRATFDHAILFGGALTMAIPLAFYLLTVAKTVFRKVFLWTAIMLMFLNIYKTGSRGPWLALVLSLGVLLVYSKNQVRKYLVVMSLLTVMILIVRPGIWDTVTNLYAATENPDTPQGASYEWRYALYHIAFQHLNQNLGRALWGYGPESFYYLGWRGEFQGNVVAFDTCDSSIAATMIETGYIGLLIVALFLLKAAVVTFRSFRKMAEPSNYLCLVFFINICAFSFLMTNVAIFGWGQQTYMLWLLIALSAIYPQLVEVQNATQKAVARVPVALSHRFGETPKC